MPPSEMPWRVGGCDGNPPDGVGLAEFVTWQQGGQRRNSPEVTRIDVSERVDTARVLQQAQVFRVESCLMPRWLPQALVLVVDGIDNAVNACPWMRGRTRCY